MLLSSQLELPGSKLPPCRVKATILLISHVVGITLKCVFGRVRIGITLQRRNTADGRKKTNTHRYNNTDGQIFCGAKLLFISSLKRRKSRGVLIFCLLPDR